MEEESKLELSLGCTHRSNENIWAGGEREVMACSLPAHRGQGLALEWGYQRNHNRYNIAKIPSLRKFFKRLSLVLCSIYGLTDTLYIFTVSGQLYFANFPVVSKTVEMSKYLPASNVLPKLTSLIWVQILPCS